MKKWVIAPTSIGALSAMRDHLATASDFIRETDGYSRQKYLVEFQKPVSIRHNHSTEKMETKCEISYFVSTSLNLCYSCRENPRHGYYVTQEMAENLISITVFSDAERYGANKVHSLVSKFHPNLWENIQQELRDDPSNMETKYYNNFSVINISSKFPKTVMIALKEAIDNKKDYSYKQYGTRRDLSVETKMGTDGIYRAWYSSEYSGCGNGAYYLLINPTTAAFCEYD